MKASVNISTQKTSDHIFRTAFFQKNHGDAGIQSSDEAVTPFFNHHDRIQTQMESVFQIFGTDYGTGLYPKTFTKPKVFWVLENGSGKALSRALYSPETVTAEQMAHAIFENPESQVGNLANINGVAVDQPIAPYTKIKVPNVNLPGTGWAQHGYKNSLFFSGPSRNPFPILQSMGVSNVEEYIQKRDAIDQQLKMELPLMALYVDLGMEEKFLQLLNKYAQINFTEYPDRYAGGGQYVDKIFLYLRGKIKHFTKFFAEQVTSYYDIIFNHFERADEVRQIRELYSEAYKGDDGIREVSYATVFVEEAFEKALRVAGVPRQEIMNFINKAGEAITEIINEPKKFLANLIDAVKSGFHQFVNNLPEYLGPGLLDWVLGKIGNGDISAPQDFSLKSIVKFALQFLQIDIRSIITEVVGAENVQRIEKIWSTIKTLIQGGLTALIDELVIYLGDLKNALVDKFKNWVVKDLVKSAVSELLQMFVPGGGLVKIIKKIYRIIEFVRNKLGDLKDLFISVGQSVFQIVKGDIGLAAANIKQTLKKGLYLLIDLLARLMKVNFIDGIRDAVKSLRYKIRDSIKKLVEKIWTTGRGAVETAKEKISEWWNLRKNFSTAEGEKHQLYFQKEKEDITLYIASSPRSFTSFINQVSINLNDKKQVQSKSKAQKIASALNKVIYQRVDKNLSREELDAFYQNKRKQVKKLLNDLSVPLATLLQSEDLPKGTYDDPIPIVWPKRGKVQVLRNLNPIRSRWERHHYTPPDRIAAAPSYGKTPLEIPPSTWKREGYQRFREEFEGTRDGQRVRYLVIGVNESNNVGKGDKVERSKTKRKGKDKIKNRLKTLLANYQYDMSDLDMDHVLDVGFMGKDEIPNLWPLYSIMNRTFGNRVYQQVVSYSDEKGNPQVQQVRYLPGKWFIIKYVGD